MSSGAWVSLLVEPKAILGPYGGEAPSLDSFAPHAWRAHFNHVAIAGHFMQLPTKLPESWGLAGRARADVVFEFSDVRCLRVEGVLPRSEEDDSMHGLPCGITGRCVLEALSDSYLENPETGLVVPWKRFTFRQAEFFVSLEAGSAMLYSGRRASSQFGHANSV